MKIKFTLLVLLVLSSNLLTAQSRATGPFFSEYIEGSTGSNKALEIFNPYPVVMDLSGCSIELYPNGASVPSQTQVLTGFLASGDVWVLANSLATDTGILNVTDQFSSVCNFNGDDALAIKCNGEYIDIIGQIGFDPGTYWGVWPPSTTLDHTLIRDSMVTAGEIMWSGAAQNQWYGFAAPEYSHLGWHTMYSTVGLDEHNESNLFRLYPNPVHGTLNVECSSSAQSTITELNIYDMTGRIVLEETLHSQLSTVNCPLSSGLYLVRVEANDMIYQQKLIVE